ncbi:MAG TPA: hydrogenase nickel incorporation protein HypB, partial [Candidatus Hydrogenedentes bacterium]|nr:hydrogenase nickel incorporation protein HypB [Candidatus Hydrogenedentota bacterium]
MHVEVVQKVMKLNDEIAEGVRARLRAANVRAVNLISAPGSGKTSLIEAALGALRGHVRVGVLEGDPDTTLDAERIAKHGVPVVQIQTAGGCHLEANLVSRALDRLPLDAIDLLIIENVGNLVCPVEFDIGETSRVAIVSTAEGHDKPAKYPKLFRTTDTVVLNKIDLL